MARRGSAIKNVYLDSSVLFSAVYSITGGSAKLFTLDNLNLYTSTLVLTEVERNVRKKLPEYKLERFLMLVSKIRILKTDYNTRHFTTILAKSQKVIVEKDAHILAEFKLHTSIDALLTLDRKDFIQNKVMDFVSPKKILTPKDLLSTAN